MQKRHAVPFAAFVAALTIIAAACGSDSSDTTTTATSASTATTLADTIPAEESEDGGSDEAADGSALDEIRVAVQVGDTFYGSDGVTADTRYRIGSTSKMFTAAVLAQLVAEGQLSFDDPIADYIDTESSATVGEVLTHRGGIVDDESGIDFNEAYANQFDEVDLAIMTDLATFTESSAMAYSNTGYIFAGDVIAAVTGEHPAVSVRQRIIEPLGLTNTCWPSVESDCEVDVPGVVNTSLVGGDGSDVLMESYTSIDALSASAGALISSTNDLGTFLTALVNEEIPGAAEMMASTTNPAFVLEESSDLYGFVTTYGYGLMVDNNGAVGHAGQTFGFNAWAAIDPATGKVSIALVNDASIAALLLPVGVAEFGAIPPLEVLLELRDA